MKKAFKIILLTVSVPVAFLYLLACLNPYISQVHFWPFSFIALGFPLIALLMLVFTVLWFFANYKIGILYAILFFAGYRNIFSVFSFHFPAEFNLAKDSATLRVLDWNALGFVENAKRYERPWSRRRKMLEYIKQVNPDVFLIQEFQDIKGEAYYSNIQVLTDTLGFKYYYLSKDFLPNGKDKNRIVRCAIFSKFPLSNMRRYPLKTSPFEENVISAEITFENRKIQLITMHLLSLELGAPDNRGEFYGRVDEDFLMNRSRMGNLRNNDIIHGKQADFVRDILNESTNPVILSGDFNSVPSSYTYHTIKGNLQDCFLKKGAGFGRTFSGLSPTLRIDYILVDKAFKVKQYTSPKLYLSDHFPVVADVSF